MSLWLAKPLDPKLVEIMKEAGNNLAVALDVFEEEHGRRDPTVSELIRTWKKRVASNSSSGGG